MSYRSRLLALFALILFAPAPTVGVLLALNAPQGTIGALWWSAMKVWLFVLPAVWYVLLEKQKFSWSKPKNGGLLIALIVGILMCITIIGVFYFFAASNFQASNIKQRATDFGLNQPYIYLFAALYWILINSLLEEYIFRFFFYRQLETLFNGKQILAIFLAAAIFTLHHSVVLTAYLSVLHNILASLGIFVAGVIWSAMYAKYRSIWIPYISHLWADIGVFSVGAYLIFFA